MNVIITTFENPFSFFCLAEEDGKDFEEPVQTTTFCNKTEVSDVSHGQYIAVLWKNKWVRGIVSMENNILIWLIDYGIYLRHNDKTVYINLPSTYKRLPTKVFEASIHGVAPVDRVLNDECEIQNKIGTEWTGGAIEKAQSLIASATQIYFVPIALLSTKYNDVVVGDLYLEIKKNNIVNIVDELELWPAFLEKNKSAYVDNLKAYYTRRRKHRACSLKPAFVSSDLPTLNFETTLAEYNAISRTTLQFDAQETCSDISEDGSTELEYTMKSPKYEQYSLTEAEIEKYSNKHVIIQGTKYNALEILTNKLRDLNMCEKYKDYDLKYIGRATHRWPPKEREIQPSGPFNK